MSSNLAPGGHGFSEHAPLPLIELHSLRANEPLLAGAILPEGESTCLEHLGTPEPIQVSLLEVTSSG